MVRVQFEPFTSVLSVGFWAGLAKAKLEAGMIKELTVYGYYEVDTSSNSNNTSPKFFVDERAFDAASDSDLGQSNSKQQWRRGKVMFVETDAEIKRVDLMGVQCDAFFVMIVYVDLKRHLFEYYLGFPIVAPEGAIHVDSITCDDGSDQQTIDDPCGRPITNDQVVLGWPTRQLLGGKSLSLLAARRGKSVFTLHLQEYSTGTITIPGWEHHLPKTVDLAPIMDPNVLARSAADLNLKLMKWQLAPGLNLTRLQGTRCVLFGAGTLGCNVLRLLLGWGVKRVTLVDSGFCSYSNPTRQSMIVLADAVARTPKVDALARTARLIDPATDITPISMRIPMPGHRHPDRPSLLADCHEIDRIVRESDAIFLLTDSRESRWLPTVLAKRHQKLCICVAIGFDSYLAMRHGPSCYFCQDSSLPLTDTVTNRTTDMQCTVSRPGVSMVAAGLGVELMVAAVDGGEGLGGGGCPQQIRGSLFGHHQQLSGPASDYCLACSDKLLSAIDDLGFDSFIWSAFQHPASFLSALTAPHNDGLPVDQDDLAVPFGAVEL